MPDVGIPSVAGAVSGAAGTSAPSAPAPAAGAGGPPPNLGAVPSAISTPTDFAKALLDRLGAPDTPQNEQALIAWMAKEGGNWHNTAHYNPLNTTLRMPGSSSMNSVGVQAFTSWQQGLDATVQTLAAYPGVLRALQSGDSALAVEQAVARSPWGTGTFDLASAAAYANTTGGVAGGGTVGGAAAGASAPPTAPYDPNAPPGSYPIDQVVRQWVLNNAPQDVWMLDNPELAPILGYVAKTGTTNVNTVNGLVSQTQWYKTHSTAQRNWTNLYASDPQEAQREIQQAQVSIRDQAGKMGVALTQDQLNTLSINTNYYQWTPDELTKAISSYLPTNQQPTAGGQAQVNFQQLKATATQTWGVPTSDQQIGTWVQQIAAGTQTLDGVTAMLKTQAQSLYPTLSDQFTRGFTFEQATDPYKQIAQRYLNVDPTTINFTDPKWMPAVSSLDPKTGQRSEMGLDQWTNYIRSNPVYGYGSTTMAKNQAYDTASQLSTLLGKVAP